MSVIFLKSLFNISLLLGVFVTSLSAHQIVIGDGSSFNTYWNSSTSFGIADSPEEIGLLDIPGSGIWYLNDLAPTTLWPVTSQAVKRDSDYVKLPDSKHQWNTITKLINIDKGDQILVDGVVLPMGHILFDEIILLYSNGDCTIADNNGTTWSWSSTTSFTTPPTTTSTTDATITTESTEASTTYDTSYQTTDSSPIYETSTYPTSNTPDYSEVTTDSTITITDNLWETPTSGPVTDQSSDNWWDTTTWDTTTSTSGPVTPDATVANFLKWKLKSFYSWLIENGFQVETVTNNNIVEGNLQNTLLNVTTKLTETSISGALSCFKNEDWRLSVSVSASLASGDLYIYVYYYNTTLNGNFFVDGTIISSLPYSANGFYNLDCSSSRLDYRVRFKIDNGYIKLDFNNVYNYYGCISLNGSYKYSVENELPSGLHQEVRANVEGYLNGIAKGLNSGGYWVATPKPFDLMYQYLSKVFEETSLLEILTTTIPVY